MKCPFCQEKIKKGAIVCKHCGKELPEIKSSRRNMILIGAVAVIVLCIAVFSTSSPDDSSPSVDTSSVDDEPKPTATIAPLAPSYEEISDEVASMTEAQWKEYLPTLSGLRVESWTGWVVDVDESLGGDYELWVDMDSPDDIFSTQDVYIPVTDDAALEFNKGQQVTFSGIIDRASEFLGDVIIHIKEGATVE